MFIFFWILSAMQGKSILLKKGHSNRTQQLQARHEDALEPNFTSFLIWNWRKIDMFTIVVSKLTSVNEWSQKLTKKIDYNMGREHLGWISIDRTFTASCSRMSCTPTLQWSHQLVHPNLSNGFYLEERAPMEIHENDPLSAQGAKLYVQHDRVGASRSAHISSRPWCLLETPNVLPKSITIRSHQMCCPFWKPRMVS
jgi:hypothetical protein